MPRPGLSTPFQKFANVSKHGLLTRAAPFRAATVRERSSGSSRVYLRNGVLSALLAPALFAAAAVAASRVSVLVVSEPGVEAYGQALAGVTAALPAGTYRVVETGKTFEQDLTGALENGEPRVVIAVGSGALAQVRARHATVPLVAALVAAGSEGEPARRRVELEIPPAAQLAAMRALWPGRTRAGIIRNPARSRFAADALEACARREGFSLVVVNCDGPSHLLKSLAGFKGKADFVLCSPDPDLYNPVTIKPLVLASIEQRLPLVGFSPAFVRAGAAAGIFPDYADVGRQAAEMALRLIRGEEHAADSESPRKIQVAINLRVARLLGVEFRAGAMGAEVYR
jgi:putative ABC transport system substrate-binding protein